MMEIVQGDITIKRFRFSNTELFLEARRLREAVFVREQQVPQELEYENEEEATHYLLYKGGSVRATGRWRRVGRDIKLERFAVPAQYRGQGYGTKILEAILKDVLHDHNQIYLHAQLTALDYYRKSGFRAIGPAFEEAGLMHHKMVYRPTE